MADNKKAPFIESNQNLSNIIIPEYQQNSNIQTSNPIFDYSIYKYEKNLKMPEILRDITIKFARTLYPDTYLTCLLVVINTLLSNAFGNKHIAFDEFDDGENVKQSNCYGIDIAHSGNGKDKLINDLQSKIFEPINVYVKNKADAITERLKQEVIEHAETLPKEEKKEYLANNKIRNVEFFLYNGTAEGFYEDNNAILNVGIGSMLCIITELALFLNDKDDRKKQLIMMLYPAYDGDIITKSIKGENRAKNLKGANVCVLLCTDPSLLKQKDIKLLLDYLLQTGLTRRSFIAFQEKSNLTVDDDAEKEYQREKTAYNCSYIRDKLFQIFLDIPDKAVYRLPKSVSKKVFHPYKRYIATLYNNTTDGMLKKEYKSRILKALKLATLYAAANHPKDLYIYEDDFEQAISMTEFMSQDFIRFLNYVNSQEDNYDKIFSFFLNNIGKKFTKTSLVTDHYSEFGFKREEFRDDSFFEKVFEVVSEIATEKGYKLNIVKHNGYKIWLESALNTDTLPSDFKPLEEII